MLSAAATSSGPRSGRRRFWRTTSRTCVARVSCTASRCAAGPSAADESRARTRSMLAPPTAAASGRSARCPACWNRSTTCRATRSDSGLRPSRGAAARMTSAGSSSASRGICSARDAPRALQENANGAERSTSINPPAGTSWRWPNCSCRALLRSWTASATTGPPSRRACRSSRDIASPDDSLRNRPSLPSRHSSMRACRRSCGASVTVAPLASASRLATVPARSCSGTVRESSSSISGDSPPHPPVLHGRRPDRAPRDKDPADRSCPVRALFLPSFRSQCHRTDRKDTSYDVRRTRHDRPDPRLLGDAPVVGELDRPLREPGLPGDRPRLPGLRGGGGVAQRRPLPGRGGHDPGDRGPAGGGRPRPVGAPDPDRPLRGGRVHPDPAGPRFRRRGGRAELGADRGCAGGPAVPGEGHLPGAEEPREPAPGGALRLRAVELRVHEHLPRGRGPRALRALRGPGVGPHPVRDSAGQPHPRPPGHLGRLPQRGPGAAAVRRWERGQDHAAEGAVVQRRPLPGHVHGHRGRRVRRQTAPAARGAGLGGDRRPRPRLGGPARRGAGAQLTVRRTQPVRAVDIADADRIV
ncbi:hypothetical protein Ae168Ps1_5949c [Pseudonocardia sp. Ae168_Ps1]|nr:hypothetical protein Ae168Ps1_5949c [Pseudonocardia sp. Ae168_Ps1]